MMLEIQILAWNSYENVAVKSVNGITIVTPLLILR